MIPNVAAELLGIDESEVGEATLKDMYEEMDKNQDGKITKDELINYLKEMEQDWDFQTDSVWRKKSSGKWNEENKFSLWDRYLLRLKVTEST